MTQFKCWQVTQHVRMAKSVLVTKCVSDNRCLWWFRLFSSPKNFLQELSPTFKNSNRYLFVTNIYVVVKNLYTLDWYLWLAHLRSMLMKTVKLQEMIKWTMSVSTPDQLGHSNVHGRFPNQSDPDFSKQLWYAKIFEWGNTTKVSSQNELLSFILNKNLKIFFG